MHIRETNEADLEDILFVQQKAFERDDVVELTRDILADPTAKPVLSLLAIEKQQPVGHVLFSKAHISNSPEINVSILAPLAVVPEFQKQGIGGKLIKKGLGILSKSGVDIVFVLGHPEYYPQHGFTPVGEQGFEAPFPIPEKDAGAWMVQELRPNIIGKIFGKVVCCEALNKPEHWRE